MTPSLETEIFWGGPNGKVVAPDILVISPVDKETRLPYKKFTSGPKYPNLSVKKAHFNVFNTLFLFLIVSLFPCFRIPKVMLNPQKMDF